MRLQERILGARPDMPDSAKALHRELRRALIAAHNEGLLRSSPAEIHKLVKLEEPTSAYCVIAGGEKNFKRDPNRPHLERDDGAWFDFAITVGQTRAMPLELIAYNFEIRFPDASAPAFIRFDLNDPTHDNEARGMRSHIHPGSDDLQVPSPLMSPDEVLSILLHDLRIERKPRHAR
jgi:hypothetical protein